MEEYGNIPYLKNTRRINIVPDFVILRSDRIPWGVSRIPWPAMRGVKWMYEIDKEAYIKFSKMWKELAR